MEAEPTEKVKAAEQIEPAEAMEPPEEIKPSEKLEQVQELSNPQLNSAYKRGRPKGSQNKKTLRAKSSVKNFTKTKVKSTKPMIPIEPPEQWTSRLRQNGREIVRDKITTVVNKKECLAKMRKTNLANETEEKRILGLERMRKREKERRANETEEQKLARLERQKMARLKLFETLTEEARCLRLERERRAGRQKYRKRIMCETEEKRILRLERMRKREKERYRRVRANETEEQKLARLERQRMSYLKRLVTETEEERSLRLERTRQRRRIKGLRVVTLQKRRLQRVEDQKADIGNYLENGDSLPKVLWHKEDEESLAWTFTIEFCNSTPKSLLHKDFTMESTTQSPITVHDPPIKKETEYDAICNLLSSICRKQHLHHPQQQNRPQNFKNLCTSRTSYYILSTVIWHKINGRIDNRIDESFIEPTPLENEIEAIYLKC